MSNDFDWNTPFLKDYENLAFALELKLQSEGNSVRYWA